MSVFRPLEGLRIIDLSVLIPGAACTHYFADYGADVVKIEQPPVGDWLRSVPPIHEGISLLHLVLNRNKRSLALDLRKPEGQAVLHRMIEGTDAVVEGSRPGALDELGAGYQVLSAINPRIVYLSLTGFGQDSQYADLPAHGANLAGFAGVAGSGVDPAGALLHGPLPWGRYRIPLEEAALHGAFALLAALRERDRTGRGDHLDVALVHTLMLGDVMAMTDKMNRGSTFWGEWQQPVAKNGLYRAADGKVLGVCPIEERFWQKFCVVLGLEHLGSAGDWSGGEVDLSDGAGELYGQIQAVIATRPRHEWLALFRQHRIPSAPLHTIDEAVSDPDLGGRLVVGNAHPVTGATVSSFAPPVQDPPGSFVAVPAPRLGEHTSEVLEDYGVESCLVDAARAAGSLAEPMDVGRPTPDPAIVGR